MSAGTRRNPMQPAAISAWLAFAVACTSPHETKRPLDPDPDAARTDAVSDAAGAGGDGGSTAPDDGGPMRDGGRDAGAIAPDLGGDPDVDRDGVDDSTDDCPAAFNPEQRDADADGLGDACDVGDTDGDGRPDRIDRCPAVGGPDTDTDADGVGDACDLCPDVADRAQHDADSDGIGDACEIPNDDDADGVPDRTDNCPAAANPSQADADGDGAGDACDACPDAPEAVQADTDGDGLGDGCDICPQVFDRADNHVDRDGDGQATCQGDCDDTRSDRAGDHIEVCDGVDNDCDRTADEDYSNLGEACATGLGACLAEGQVVCDRAGEGTVCSAAAGRPGSEICDDMDNDCDGVVDEALVGCCDRGEVEACGSDVGACRRGRRVCNAERTWGACDALGPAAETCNGEDDDCDGATDEDLGTQRCGEGECAVQTAACVGGRVGPCEPRDAARPELCNARDDDCDGRTDEAFDLETDGRHCGACGEACLPGVECRNGICGGLFTFEGVALHLAEDSLRGWRRCYVGGYDARTLLDEALGPCDGRFLLLGCRVTGAEVLDVAAMGERDAVLLDTSVLPGRVHTHNGVQFYFSGSYSMGFAPDGVPVALNSCDTEAAQSESRLCWHTAFGALAPGYRCGAPAVFDQTSERVVYTSIDGR